MVRRSLVYTTDATVDSAHMIHGSPSEACFVNFALTSGNALVNHMFEERDREGVTIICERFTSSRKRFTRASWIDEGAKVRVFSKGASELNLDRCTQIIGADGIVK